jgi:hypothetical protein
MTRPSVVPVFSDRAAVVVAVFVGLTAVVEYVTTGTVGTGTLVVAIAVTLVGNAMRKEHRAFAVEAERGTEEREKTVSPALEVKEHGTERGMKRGERT